MTDETSFHGGHTFHTDGAYDECDSCGLTRADHPGQSYFADVAAFHAKMGLPVSGVEEPRVLTAQEFEYRRRFLEEELQEFVDAYFANDVPGMADALVDLTYVALGTAHYMGVPFDEVWREVQRANMEKRRWQEGDAVKPRAAGVPGLDVIKPPGWRGPDVAGVIARFKERLVGRV